MSTGPRFRMKRIPIGDPYLLWLYNSRDRFFPTEVKVVVLFVSFKKAIDAALRSSLARSEVRISALYDGYTHATARVSLCKLPGRINVLLDAGMTCISLASPTTGPRWVEPAAAPVFSNGPNKVLGIIDDGCPFAHRAYRTNAAAPFAVKFIWDQGGTSLGSPPVNYGRTLLEGQLQTLVVNATAAGVVDEDAAYRKSGLPSLRDATGHGAQVMSHATGNARPHRQPSLGGRNDIAFVQLPPEALDDPSGRWMDHYALDGIQAIRFYARKMFLPPAQHVVVNLSYGPQTGPHDGNSIFEQAVDQITEKADAESWKLNVVVPAGNSHLLRAHAEFALAQNLKPLTWCVSPDSQVPSYLEIWPPVGVSLTELDVTLTSPTGEPPITAVDLDVAQSLDGTATVTSMPFCGKPNQYLIVMVIAATARPRESTAPVLPLAVPGRWKVGVTVRPGQTANGIAHAYLARIDPNLGRKLRGHIGYLYSPNYDPQRYLRASSHLSVSPPPSSVEVMARGSLSGIATGSRVEVAAGYVSSGKPANIVRKPSMYSSGGRSRIATRIGPDYAYPTDDSPVLYGRLAGGNRSGTVTRLVGTSFAAPMYALDLLDPSLVRDLPLTGSMPAWFTYRCGKGQRKA